PNKYIAWCEMHEGKCAFVVYVPEYRKFDRDAKKVLAKMAWRVAQEVSRTHFDTDDHLAVGMHGLMSYGTVMVGRVADDDFDAAIENQTHDENGHLLLPFFVRPEGEILNFGPVPEPPKLDPNAQLQNTKIDPALNPFVRPKAPE